MSKLEDILEDFGYAAVNNTETSRTTVIRPAKQQIKQLFLEVINKATVERRFELLTGETIDLLNKAELTKLVESL
jgi:hypothetical protein